MLTRDISLDDCILDLVDNSVDGAWSHVGSRPTELVVDEALKNYHIDIQFDASTFSILDNCGGITLDNAADYAFTFGRREGQSLEEFSVGVYGIGMKRAVFKIGQQIRITSTYVEDAASQSFAVPISVSDWMDDASGTIEEEGARPSWDFDIEEAEPLQEAGVFIEVQDLNSETAERLGDESYARGLRRVLARDYMVPLMRGLTISVNGINVVGQSIELRVGDAFAPMRAVYQDGDVSVELLAGMISEPPDSTEPDESERRAAASSGWYILCNGRVVLAADTSSLTGWGEGLPLWHRQYSGFVGFALFSSSKAADLPMTTTKRSVDVSRGVYRRALARMFEPTRAWISYTNSRKSDLDAAKIRENATTTQVLSEVPARPSVELPKLTTKVTRERVGNINYAMPLKRIRELAEALGNSTMSYRDVGIESFEFSYADLVGEGD